MSTKSESPRYILILGSLFLLAYAAYNLGVAWIDSVPPVPVAIQTEAPASTPTPFLTPTITPTNRPLFWITPTLVLENLTVSSETEAEQSETAISTVSNEDQASEVTIPTSTPTPTPSLTLTPVPQAGNPYPGPETSPTVTIAGSGYPGPGELPQPTSSNPYPGPGSTPFPTINNPYPGPGATPTLVSIATSTPTQIPQFTPTQMLTGTPQSTGPVPTQVFSTGTPLPLITTLPYSETQVVSNAAIQQVVWTQSEDRLSLATSRGLYLYDAENLKIISILDSSSNVLSNQLAFNDEIAISGGNDGVIRWWDLESEGYLGELRGNFLGVPHLKIPVFGAYLVSGGDDAGVRIWDIANFYNLGVDSVELQHTFRNSVTRITDLDVSPNGDLVAATSQQHVHVWSPQTGQLIKTIRQPEGWYTAVAFSPNSQFMVTAYEGKKLEFWDTFTWERKKFIPLTGSVKALAYSPDGFYLAIGFEDNRIQIWDMRTMQLRAEENNPAGLSNLVFDPSGRRLATSSIKGTLRIWDLTPLFRIE